MFTNLLFFKVVLLQKKICAINPREYFNAQLSEKITHGRFFQNPAGF